MTTQAPRVVACLPAWKAEPFIEATLRSLAAQSYPTLRVLASDDASPDGTWDLLQSFAQQHSQFELHRQPRNLGWIGNVNWLLRRAEGDLAFFAFHDDPLEPGYVQALVDALQRRPDAVLAFSDACVDYRGLDESWQRRMSFADLDGTNDVYERLAVMTRRPPGWWLPNRGLMRMSALRRVGGMRRHLAGEFCADWPWLLHLSLLGPFVRVPQPLVHKHWRGEGLSKSWRWTRRRRAAVTLACLREILRADLPLALRLRLAGTSVAIGRRTVASVGRRIGLALGG